MARMYVILATVGRPALVEQTVARVFAQVRPPDGMLVIATSPRDVGNLGRDNPALQVVMTEKGLCRQRNCGLDLVGDRADVVVFFDDDFVPAGDYLANVERLFDSDPAIVGITGDLVDDGIQAEEIPYDEAVRRLDRDGERPQTVLHDRSALYGCNMAMRVSALEGLRFDESLPLYGWQEDIDFTQQLGRRGRLVSGPDVTGIHLGSRGARSPGKRLGYSQVANIVYLWRKGTMQPKLGQRLIVRNVVSNLARSLRPEPHIDRRGRLLGNVIAFSDWLRGRLDPRRIERM